MTVKKQRSNQNDYAKKTKCTIFVNIFFQMPKSIASEHSAADMEHEIIYRVKKLWGL